MQGIIEHSGLFNQKYVILNKLKNKAYFALWWNGSGVTVPKISNNSKKYSQKFLKN